MSAELKIDSELRCVACDSKDVIRIIKEISFPYGAEPKTVFLKATVPVFRCSSCAMEFLGEEAEELQHEAICAHLGVMTPKEIAHLVHSYGMDRESFAELSKIGIATLGRWERGEYIQLAANDQYLYLLSFPDNLQRLLHRGVPSFKSQIERDMPSVNSAAPRIPASRKRLLFGMARRETSITERN
jgi:DNA-binding transcriptional regulator YiaG